MIPRSLRPSQALWAPDLWRMYSAGFHHSAGFHARVVLDGAACRLGDPWELMMYWVFLEHIVVPIVVRVLVSCGGKSE